MNTLYLWCNSNILDRTLLLRKKAAFVENERQKSSDDFTASAFTSFLCLNFKHNSCAVFNEDLKYFEKEFEKNAINNVTGFFLNLHYMSFVCEENLHWCMEDKNLLQSVTVHCTSFKAIKSDPAHFYVDIFLYCHTQPGRTLNGFLKL